MSTPFLPDDEQLPFGFHRKPTPEGSREENWQAIQEAIRMQEEAGAGQQAEIPERVVRRIPWVRILTAAACVLGLVVGIWYTATKTGHPQVSYIHTGYGELKTVLLPDSSTVVLNANSTLRLTEDWAKQEGRQVWLEGEAYFKVQRGIVTGQKFVVHTDALDVEVLGTRFNVNTRRKRSIVSLEEGKVRLTVHGDETAVLEKKAPLIMRPGEVVTIDSKRQTNIDEDKDVVARSGWSRHEFHFDSTSLGDIAKLIEDTYGYKMVLADTAMASVAISGDLRVNNVQELTKVLEVSSGYRMRIREKAIYVSKN